MWNIYFNWGNQSKSNSKEALDRFNKIKTIENKLKLDDGGEYAFRVNGEEHSWSPSTVSNLQKACKLIQRSFKQFQGEINGFNKSIYTIRKFVWNLKNRSYTIK